MTVKYRTRRITAAILSLLLCCSLFCGSVLADPDYTYDPEESITLTAVAEEQSDGSYIVTYTAEVSISSGYWEKADKALDRNNPLHFVCELSDDLIGSQSGQVSADMITHTGPFDIIDAYKLDDSIFIDCELHEVGPMTMKATQTVSSIPSGIILVTATITAHETFFNTRVAFGMTTLQVIHYAQPAPTPESETETVPEPEVEPTPEPETTPETEPEPEVLPETESEPTTEAEIIPVEPVEPTTVTETEATVPVDEVMDKIAEAIGIEDPDPEKIVVYVNTEDGILLLDTVILDGELLVPMGEWTWDDLIFGYVIPGDSGIAYWLITDHIIFIRGYPDGSVQPNGNMTRAEAAQMFYRLLLKPDVEITAGFSDVAEGAWYQAAVETLASIGFLNGYEDGTFRPDQPITRAEFTAIAMRFVNMLPGTLVYSDVDIEFWAKEAIVAASVYGYITGYEDGTFRPNDLITRAEVVTIMCRMLQRPGDFEAIDNGEGTQFTDLTAAHWAWYSMEEASTEHDPEMTGEVEAWVSVQEAIWNE